jgi:hypothetical protein
VGAGAGATFTIEGGTLNIASRFLTANAITYSQSGGTVNVTTVANAQSSAGGLELSSASTNFTMSGGSIVLVQANTASSGKRDYNVTAGTPSITGGTLQVGSAATAANFTFQVAGRMPNLVLDNTGTAKSATIFAAAPASQCLDVTANSGSTLNLNAFALTAANVTIGTGGTINLNGGTLTVGGASVSNGGTLTGTTAGSTLAFSSASLAQSYSGTGTVTAPLANLTIDSPAGVTLSSGLASNVIVTNANLFRGTLTNSNKLTLGNGGSTSALTTIGRVGLATAAGAYDVAPTFNAGSGGYSVSYQPEGGGHTTGFEIPSGRTLQNLTINNANGVTLAGGDLTVNGTLTFTSGNVATGGSTLAIGAAGTVTRTSGHVVGNLRKSVATGTPVSRTFEIGTGSTYAPATVAFSSVLRCGHAHRNDRGRGSSQRGHVRAQCAAHGEPLLDAHERWRHVHGLRDHAQLCCWRRRRGRGPELLRGPQVQLPQLVGDHDRDAHRDQHTGHRRGLVQRLRGRRELAQRRRQRGRQRHDLAVGDRRRPRRREPGVHVHARRLLPRRGRARGRRLRGRARELHVHERHHGPHDLRFRS